MKKRIYFIWMGLLLFALSPKHSDAGLFEFSAGLSLNRSNYENDSFSWRRRIGFSLGYRFSEMSTIEAAYEDIISRSKIRGYQDLMTFEQVYSMSWVQSLLGKSSPIQPYVKGGIGQLNRRIEGTYADGTSPPRRVDSVTVILGTGLRIFLTQTFALRSEFTSYLKGGAISTWRDNVYLSFGTSIYF